MTHHGAGLLRLTQNATLVDQLKANWIGADLAAADWAMLAYAVKLTHTPWAMAQADVQALREVGFCDADILDINQVTGYYAYVNRLADGLGVELEDIWSKKEN